MRAGLLLLFLLFLSPGSFGDVTWTSDQSDCLGDIDNREDAIEIEVVGCRLVIRHLDVVINCCLEYSPTVEVNGDTIRVTEVDTGPPCDCICPFDLEIVIEGLEPGAYTVVLSAFLHPDPLREGITIPLCEGFVLMGEQVWASLGTTGVVMPVSASNPEPLQGFSFGTTFPTEHAVMTEITLDGRPATARAGLWRRRTTDGAARTVTCAE